MKRLLFVFGISLAWASSACALRISGPDGWVHVGESVHVPEGTKVQGPAVAIGGSVLIDGEVEGPAVAVGGDIRLGSKAVLEEAAVAVGGRIIQEPGARFDGEKVEIGSLRGLNRLLKWVALPVLAGGLGILAGLSVILKLTGLLSWVLLGVLGVLFFEKQMDVVCRQAVGRLGRNFLTGMGLSALLAVLMVLFAVTLVGIPLSILIALAYTAASFFGYMSLGYFAGRRILDPSGTRKSHPALPAAMGVLGLRLIHWIPIFGKLVTLVLFLIGLGAVYYTRFGTKPE